MPTPKQRLAAQKLLENTRKGNPKSMGEVLVDSGYSEETALTPTQVTKSRGFLQVLEEAGVTDDRLSQVLEEGLGATKKGEVDHYVRHKYLETAVKLKGHLKPSDSGDSGNTYNTFVQQNNFNPNAIESKTLVDNTLAMLMQQTKDE